VRLGTTQEKLEAIGVETVAVVNTTPERARLYFKYRPPRMPLGVDPEAATHRAFGLPAPALVDDESAASWPLSATMGQYQLAVRVTATLNERDGFELVEADHQIIAAHGTQLGGHFLIDREGIIRWRQIEAAERIDDLAKFPSDEEILRAARSL
jgi:AhpC/TSA antioxidant enzyme